jgi:hypothetical protein
MPTVTPSCDIGHQFGSEQMWRCEPASTLRTFPADCPGVQPKIIRVLQRLKRSDWMRSNVSLWRTGLCDRSHSFRRESLKYFRQASRRSDVYLRTGAAVLLGMRLRKDSASPVWRRVCRLPARKLERALVCCKTAGFDREIRQYPRCRFS